MELRIKNAIGGKKVQENNDLRGESPPLSSVQIDVREGCEGREGAADNVSLSSKASSIVSNKSKGSIKQRIKSAMGRKKVVEDKDLRKESPPLSSIQIAVEVKDDKKKHEGREKKKKKKLKQDVEEVQTQQLTAPLIEHDFQLRSSNDSPWTGRVVGLRLPSTVDPAFDEKCKPNNRRVDPSLFLKK